MPSLPFALYVFGSLAVVGVMVGLIVYAWHHRRQIGHLLLLHDISGRIRAEEALRSSEAQLRAIFDHSPSAIILFDTTGDILLWNAAAEKMYGWKAQEVLGTPLPTVPGERIAEKQAFQERVNRGEVISYTQVQRQRKDGSTIFVSLSVAPLKDAAGRVYAQMSITTDITEQTRIAQALRESEEHYRQLLEDIPVPVAIYDLDDTGQAILYVNRIGQKLWRRCAPVDGDDPPLVQFAPGNEEAFVAGLISRMQRAGRTEWLEACLVAPDGQEMNVLGSAMPVTHQHRPAALVVLNDITELKQAQADLLHREQALTALQERERIGRELHDGLGQMLGYLNVQVQATQTLLASGLTLAAQANLQQMAQVAQDTHANLRSHILGLRAPLPTQEDMFQALGALLQQFSTSSGIAATLSVPADVAAAPFMPAVEEQILRIIQEALANVRKHANAHKVEVLFSFTPEQAQIMIVDDGVGFDPVQAKAAGANAPHFGLAIMRERAEQIGGRLEVRSALGKGTQIVLFAPRFMAGGAAPLHDDLAVIQRIRVLLVDDHPLFLDGMRNLLRARGITVVGIAQDGVEAQAQARALHPDVVVMDVEMPRCDGVEATRLIKAEFPEIKIILLTVSESEDHLFAALRNGASGYLLKSLDANEFCQLLADVMRGEVPLPPGLAARVLAAFAHHPASPQVRAPDPALTAQQSTILTLVAAGKLYKEVAAELNLSEKTIKYHMGQILDRLHLETREEAIAYLRRSQPG